MLKKVGSHGDNRGVLLACEDEKIGYLGYYSSKYLSKPRKQTTMVTTMLAG